MVMENPVKERLMQFLECKNISQRKFEIDAELSNGYVNNLKNSIGSEKLQNIIYAYPELNIRWLLTGEGEMLKQDAADNNINIGKENPDSKNITELIRQHGELIKQQGELIEIIKKISIQLTTIKGE